MTVKELKEMLSDLPDDMDVLIPMEPMEGFTGVWFSPCIEESSVVEMALDEYGDETEDSLALVPCGFFDIHEGPPAELN